MADDTDDPDPEALVEQFQQEFGFITIDLARKLREVKELRREHASLDRKKAALEQQRREMVCMWVLTTTEEKVDQVVRLIRTLEEPGQ